MNSWFKSPESSPPALPEELPTRDQGFGATKKRWLRQAISEECDSPNSRQGKLHIYGQYKAWQFFNKCKEKDFVEVFYKF